MTDLKVPCQVATGYGALCGMKLHPVAITNIIHLGKGSFASSLVLTCQQRSLLGQFWYAWKHINTSSRDLKICPAFSTFLMLEWAKDIIFLQWVQRSYLWSYNSALFHCLSLVCFSQFGRWENKKKIFLFAIICLQGCQANLSAFMSCCFFLAVSLWCHGIQ